MGENIKTYLSFQISEDTFAVDALKVDHIMEMPPSFTTIPNVQKYMRGIVNLHGNIIPVVDMRIIMESTNEQQNEDTSIIVINPDNKLESRLGIVVDAVKEVIEVEKSELKETILDGIKGEITTFEGTFSRAEEFIHVIDINNFVETIE